MELQPLLATLNLLRMVRRRCGRRGCVTATVLATSLAEDGATTPSVSRRCRVVASDRQEIRNHRVPETVEAREQRLAGKRARRRERLALESAEERETGGSGLSGQLSPCNAHQQPLS